VWRRNAGYRTTCRRLNKPPPQAPTISPSRLELHRRVRFELYHRHAQASYAAGLSSAAGMRGRGALSSVELGSSSATGKLCQRAWPELRRRCRRMEVTRHGSWHSSATKVGAGRGGWGRPSCPVEEEWG
jgi:hypothetical protein